MPSSSETAYLIVFDDGTMANSSALQQAVNHSTCVAASAVRKILPFPFRSSHVLK